MQRMFRRDGCNFILFFSALTGHESVLLGVGSLFYATGHLVILPVLSQSRCFREGRDFNLEAKPRTGQRRNQLHFNEKTKQSERKESAI